MSYFEQTVAVGNLTHNNAVPAANNVGVLPSIASTAAPTYVEGDQVLLSVDLAGNIRTITTITGGVEILDSGGSNKLAINASGQVTISNTGFAVTQTTSPWIIAGGGTAGAPGTAVLTVQGISGGQAVPVSGSIAVSGVTGVVEVSATSAANASGNPIYVSAAITGTPTVDINSGQTITVTNAGTFAVQATGTVSVSGIVTTKPASPITASWSQLPIDCSSLGANIIVPAVSLQSVRIMRIFFVNCNTSTSTNITIQDTTPTSFTGAILLLNAGVFTGPASEGEPLWISALGRGIQIYSSAAVQLSGTVWYTQS